MIYLYVNNFPKSSALIVKTLFNAYSYDEREIFNMIFFRVHCGQGDRHEDIREDQENTDLGGVQGEVQQPRGVRALQVQGGGDLGLDYNCSQAHVSRITAA